MIKRLIVTAVLMGAVIGCSAEPPPVAKDPEAAKRTSDRARMIENSAKKSPVK